MIDKYIINSNKETDLQNCAKTLWWNWFRDAFAMFYKNNKDWFDILEAKLLIDFVQSYSFTEKEFETYRLWISQIKSFFQSCLSEKDTWQ